jgi:UDPglucose 6-dehydrogenase
VIYLCACVFFFGGFYLLKKMFLFGSARNRKFLELPRKDYIHTNYVAEVTQLVKWMYSGDLPRKPVLQKLFPTVRKWETHRSVFLSTAVVVVEINSLLEKVCPETNLFAHLSSGKGTTRTVTSTEFMAQVQVLLDLCTSNGQQLIFIQPEKGPPKNRHVRQLISGYLKNCENVNVVYVNDIQQPVISYPELGIVGCGVVGKALLQTLGDKGFTVQVYDKYIAEFKNTLEVIRNCRAVFLCLPTLYSTELNEYDKGPIHETCAALGEMGFSGEVVIKSTVEPGTTAGLQLKYPNLRFVHNPEFLTARRALEDSRNQTHVVLGYAYPRSLPTATTEKVWRRIFPGAHVSVTDSTTSECLKLACNCFYSVKVQFFNELALFCRKKKVVYSQLRRMLLLNKFTSPMHTHVPGPDGKLTFGGMCFPKDTRALLAAMQSVQSEAQVLQSTVTEQHQMRPNAASDEAENINLDTVVVRLGGATEQPSAQAIRELLLEYGALVVEEGTCDVAVTFAAQNTLTFPMFEKIFCAHRVVPGDVGLLAQGGLLNSGHNYVRENGHTFVTLDSPDPQYTRVTFPERLNEVKRFWDMIFI